MHSGLDFIDSYCSSFLKFPQVPLSSLKFPQVPSSSLKLHQVSQVPSRSLKFRQVPASSLKFPQAPSTSGRSPPCKLSTLELALVSILELTWNVRTLTLSITMIGICLKLMKIFFFTLEFYFPFIQSI